MSGLVFGPTRAGLVRGPDPVVVEVGLGHLAGGLFVRR